ncbi:MAG: DNA-protecting protein DprA [Verrucomicrobia bacterium]|nr:MAG: DNA-protecting protein DprA [Verrucomicrobiota bacterium]TAE89169.1 MAG: DNA-protecting protein DprA [Verrucomicrobiota bacterium]TAF27955.1 MAG: DNA-protecting protein DprA [Verrucomicrobiota bacterium]TAF42803.1 MAG: DNA-protecting protein DprA [Verrucomicrobiota bacterium]
MTALEALVALNLLPKIGPVRIRRLLDRFDSPAAVLTASKDELLRIDGIGEETAGILTRWQDHADPTKELREVHERGLSLIHASDPAFPPSLREAYDAPLFLYVWGKIEERDRHAIGVVGTRRITTYGRNVTKKLSFELAHAGFTIVSGLARGVDTVAHEAAVAANGRTIAVIGSGLAKLFPAENLALAEKIADGHGAVVSEFPLHTSPDKQTFPQRNRIVAAWSRALLVTECPAWSGSLITANLAAEYGRPVFAVPGPITSPTSSGCNRLIRDGATLVTDGSDILDDLGELPFARQSTLPLEENHAVPELPPEEASVFAALGDHESGVDRLIDMTGLPSQIVTATLMKLEMRRLVRALPGFRYVKR